MDTATIVGLAVAWGGLLLAAILAGTNLMMFANLEAFLIIGCGVAGTIFISYPMSVMVSIPSIMKNAFFAKEVDYMGTIQTLVNFATKARREGLLGLEEDVDQLQDKFLQKGMQLVVDGTDIELVRNIMDTDLAFLEMRHRTGEGLFTAAGGFAPTLGIVGTVMGLINVLATLDDPSKVGPAVAVAFIATLYGIGVANLIFLPIAGKLKFRSGEEVLLRQLTIEGVVSISAGDNPRIVEEKLKAFLPPKFKALAVAGGGSTKGGEEPAPAAPAAGGGKK